MVFVYYESVKREPQTRPIYECRCDERLKAKSEESTVPRIDWVGRGDCLYFVYVYYESIKREPKIRGIYECRCDERLQTKTKKFTRCLFGSKFICSRLKKRRKPRVKLVTLKLC
jgi:hypothetical protein